MQVLCSWGPEEGISSPEVTVFVSHPKWVLGSEPRTHLFSLYLFFFFGPGEGDQWVKEPAFRCR